MEELYSFTGEGWEQEAVPEELVDDLDSLDGLARSLARRPADTRGELFDLPDEDGEDHESVEVR